jgi:ABC-2 type transport system ATP-binding protein
MPVAEIKGLTVQYGAKTAISDLTFEAPEGCVGLLGPNGAGKTTLIKTLLGFVAPTRGGGSVLGFDVASQGLKIRQNVGLMPESDCHIPGMNAVAFVAYAGELSGMPASRAMSRAHEVLEYCGLGEARYRPVEGYSTGMKQKIKLAQALVHGPKLIFLDEPTNGMDPAGRDEMLNLIRDVSHGKGVNVIVSSHLLHDIERVCDSVVVMRGGKIAAQGEIASLQAMEGVQADVELRIASDAFVAEAMRRGAEAVPLLGPRYRVSLPAETEDVGRLLFEIALASDAQIRGFRPASRSLEDIFLGALE